MAYINHPLIQINQFLPENAFDLIIPNFKKYNIHITITKKRKTLLGNYKNPDSNQTHKITINGNLNPYEFLITLVHELAHLEVYVLYKNKVASHGTEWKKIFAEMMQPFLNQNIFPNKIHHALVHHLKDAKYSHTADVTLMKTIRSHNKDNGMTIVSEIGVGNSFRVQNNIYNVLEKRRTRYLCRNMNTGKTYLFPGAFEVKSWSNDL